MDSYITYSIDYLESRQRLRNTLFVTLLILLSLVYAIFVFHFSMGPYAILSFAILMIIGLTAYKPIFGFYIFLSLTLLLEQYPIGEFQTLTQQIPFFNNLNSFTSLYFPVNPLELFLVLILVAWFIKGVLNKKLSWYKNQLLLPTSLFLIALSWAEVYGLTTGGDWKVSLWEVRALVYLCIVIFLLPNLVASKKEIRGIFWISIISIGVKALQGIWRYFFVIRGNIGVARAVTAHEDALFFASLFILVIVMYLFGAPKMQKYFLTFLSPLLLMAFILTNRRACYVALIIGLVTLIIIVPREKKILLAKFFIPIIPIMLVYVPTFWNNFSPVGMPVQAIKSVFRPTARDIDSNLYRKMEETNLMATINESPIIGIGFGNKYKMVVALNEIGYSLRDYIPHNEILWLWAKTGTIGFSIFWFFIGSIIVKGCCMFRTLRDNYLKSIVLTALILVIMQMMVSYADLQLTFYRNMIYMGALLGMMIAAERIDKTNNHHDTC